MTNYSIYHQGKKIVIDIDGFQYAVYASDIYHMYSFDGGQWRRIKAPALNHKCSIFGNTIIGDIFQTLQTYAQNQ